MGCKINQKHYHLDYSIDCDNVSRRLRIIIVSLGYKVTLKLFALLVLTSASLSAGQNKNFKLTIYQEPTTLDHNLSKSPGTSYLLSQLNRNLFKVNKELNVEYDLAQSCQFKKMTFTCKLKDNLKWSDGSDLTAHDFIRSYEYLVDGKNPVFRRDLVSSFVKNNKLLVKAVDNRTLEFNLPKINNEIQYILALDILAPKHKSLNYQTQGWEKYVSSGPFKIKLWSPIAIILTTNPYYWQKNSRPDVEFLIIKDDLTALQLYENGELDFLRRLPTTYISKYKYRSDFMFLKVLRFDYIAMNSKKISEDMRTQILHALKFNELQDIFSAPTIPGCYALESDWLNKNICYNYDNQKLKKNQLTEKYQYLFSKLGGEDHKRAAEWLQASLSKIGISLDLNAKENKSFNEDIQNFSKGGELDKYHMIRKGVGLEIPTCHNALEVFTTGHSENYINFSDKKYDSLVSSMLSVQVGPDKKTNQSLDYKKLCTQALEILDKQKVIIPLGEISFAMLLKANVRGLKLNSLNQMDLSELSLHDK